MTRLYWKLALLEDDKELLAMVEVDTQALQIRRSAFQKLIDTRFLQTQASIDKSNWRSTFMKARILFCNALVTDALFYKPLWNRLSTDDYEPLQKWISGIVKPLAHLNQRCHKTMSIKEFQGLSSASAFSFMWQLSESSNSTAILQSRTILTYEIMPYLAYSGSYEEFLNVIFNEETFPFNTQGNFDVFKMIALEFQSYFPDSFVPKIQLRIVQILFEKGYMLKALPGPDPIEEHELILSSINNDICINGIELATLKSYSENMHALQIFNLKDIRKLADDDELVQKSFFASLCKQLLQRSSSALLNYTEVLMHNDCIFTKVDSKTKEFMIAESLLASGEFAMLRQFTSDTQIKIEDSVLLRFFWNFFNNASNGSCKRPDMISAQMILELLPSDRYVHLSHLLNVCDHLSKYFLSFSKGVIFKPSTLLEFKTQPFEIISKLLELNPQLCRNTNEVFKILKELYGAFQLQSSSPEFHDEFTRLLVLHIDFALANLDFEFAYQKTQLLLEKGNCRDFWSTILQVGKFFDPSWIDCEIPTEIIYLQLEVLGKLLHICPEDEIEAVVSQWSGLELELSTRDLINDQYSLSNGGTDIDFKNHIVEEVSASVSNFLSSGVKWANDAMK